MRVSTGPKSTFDSAQDRFRRNPNRVNGRSYREVVLEYWEDEMISDETLLVALHEIKSH